MEKGYTDELIFRALGDKHRLEILSHLLENEMNAGLWWTWYSPRFHII